MHKFVTIKKEITSKKGVVNMVKHLGVRELVETVMQSGNLVPDNNNFTALQGSQIHRDLQQQHLHNYQSEVYLKKIITINHQDYQIDGRADGIFSQDGHDVIEEIKTSKPTFNKLNPNKLARYWGQVKVYGYFWCAQKHLNQIHLQLTYVRTIDHSITKQMQVWQYDDLKKFFYSLIRQYESWLLFKDNLIQKRNTALQQMTFPFANYRHGQQALIQKITQIITNQQQLIVEAPTGIGKTISTIYPALKAMGNNQIQRIFYLTAKQSTRHVVEETLALLEQQQPNFAVKCITLTAKDQITFADEPSDPHQNPYMKGYYDRLKPAIIETITNYNIITRQIIEKQAQKYMLDPFNFANDLSDYCDIIICDYNYIFDPTVAMQRFLSNDDKINNCFLIDEAHNLLKRARDMYSATLSQKTLLKLLEQIDNHDALNEQLQPHLIAINDEFKALLTTTKQYALTTVPINFIHELQKFTNFLGKWLPKYEKSTQHPLLETIKTYYFECLSFLKINNYYDQNYQTIVTSSKTNITIELFCLDPSCFLKQRLHKASSAVLFSATLSPLTYYQAVLGMDSDSEQLQLPSPFNADQQLTLITSYIQTAYKQRLANIPKIVATINTLINSKKGNYLIFCPSFAFLKQVVAAYHCEDDNVKVIIQKERMNSKQRHDFLQQFEIDHDETLVGFGVLGGIFAEGIDLQGEKLIGVGIISVGLPQINLKNNLLRDYFDQLNGQGFSYAYLIPGINNVIQAAGRLIRSSQDKGAVLLMDQRFNYQQYRKLLPTFWQLQVVNDQSQLTNQLHHFW